MDTSSVTAGYLRFNLFSLLILTSLASLVNHYGYMYFCILKILTPSKIAIISIAPILNYNHFLVYLAVRVLLQFYRQFIFVY